MNNDPFPSFSTLNLTQLGKLFDETSHVVGRWLKEIGVRLPNGEPTQVTIQIGLVERVISADGLHPFWAWRKEQAVRLLERAGHKRIGPPEPSEPPPQKLIGPFSARRSDPEGGGFEIADLDGTVAIWCRGEWLAGIIVKLLNLCHRHGKFFD